jgi:RNA polymerase sigma factor (sigma-70 family)
VSQNHFQQQINEAATDDDVRRLVSEYGPYIRKVIRSRLDERLRPKFDSMDFEQMVWISFFKDRESFRRFDTPERLVRYLARMARNKVVDEERRRLRKNNRYRINEKSLDDEDSGSPAAPENTPSQNVMAREERASLFASIESERDREILRLRLRGLSFKEIAQRIGVNEKTARRSVDRLLQAQKN